MPRISRTDDKNRFTHEQVQILSLIFPPYFLSINPKVKKPVKVIMIANQKFYSKIIRRRKIQVGIMKMAKRLKLDVNVVKKVLKDPDCMSKIEEDHQSNQWHLPAKIIFHYHHQMDSPFRSSNHT